MLYSHISDLTLPPEIILKIIEEMDYEPNLFAKIMCISRDFRDIVKINEKSLTTHFALKFLASATLLPQSETYDSVPRRKLRLHRRSLMSSSMTFVPIILSAQSFPWLYEVYKRFLIVDQISTGRFEHVVAGIEDFYPVSYDDGDSATILFARVRLFLRLSLHKLFCIFDVRCDNSLDGRAAQVNAIESAGYVELAMVSLLLYLASLYYCYNSIWCYKSAVAQQRMQGIYRELALTHGPQFIWASLFGNRRQKSWVKLCIERGLTELRMFERIMSLIGRPFNFTPSLQNFMFMEFYRRANCGSRDGLSTIIDVVKHEVLFARP